MCFTCSWFTVFNKEVVAHKILTETEQKALKHLPLVHTWGRKLRKQTEVSKIRQHSLALEQHSEEETHNDRQKNIITRQPHWLDNTKMFKNLSSFVENKAKP